MKWEHATVNSNYFMIAKADNGMTGIVFASDEAFAMPGAFVEHAGLRKIPRTIFLDPETATKWCEEEMAQWIPIPKTST